MRAVLKKAAFLIAEVTVREDKNYGDRSRFLKARTMEISYFHEDTTMARINLKPLPYYCNTYY